jgi:hypothetical protein
MKSHVRSEYPKPYPVGNMLIPLEVQVHLVYTSAGTTPNTFARVAHCENVEAQKVARTDVRVHRRTRRKMRLVLVNFECIY